MGFVFDNMWLAAITGVIPSVDDVFVYEEATKKHSKGEHGE